MLPEILFDPLYRFLTEIDRFISKQVTDRRTSHEPGVTDNFLWCLDEEARFPDGLRFPILELKREVAELVGEDFPIDVLFKAEGYSQTFEGGVSQADYGFTLDFTDPSEDLHPRMRRWSATYFMQSKVAKRSGDDLRWDMNANFNPTSGQADAITRLRQLVGHRGLRYHLYCPQHALSMVEPAKLLAEVNSLDTSLCEWSHYLNAGFWLTHSFPRSIQDLMTGMPSPVPWALFVLAHFFDVSSPDGALIKTDKLYMAEENAEFQFRRDLFERKRDAVEAAVNVQKQFTGEQMKLLDSYFSAQTHRTVSIKIAFPTLDYENSCRTESTLEDGREKDLQNDAGERNQSVEQEAGPGSAPGSAPGMKPKGTG